MATTHPPTIVWSKDFSWLAYLGVRVKVDDIRSGLHNLVDYINAQMASVTDDVLLPITVPLDIPDDLTNDTPHHTWLDNEAVAMPKMPILQALMQPTSKFKVYTQDAAGNVVWLDHGMRTFLQFCADINLKLSVVNHMVPSQPSRGTENGDLRIRNGHRHRNWYVIDGEVVTIVQATKMENITGCDDWIPQYYPSELSFINQYFLLLLRPVEAFFASKVFGSPTKDIYQEQLYVQDGKRMTSEAFSNHLAQVTSEYMGAALKIRAWRHIAIALRRRHIPPSSVDPFHVHDSAEDHAASHGTRTARTTYAIDRDNLPSLSSDAMIEFSTFCELWHAVLGFGKLPIPKPIAGRRMATVLPSSMEPPVEPMVSDGGAIAALAQQLAAITRVLGTIQDKMDTHAVALQRSIDTQVAALRAEIKTMGGQSAARSAQTLPLHKGTEEEPSQISLQDFKGKGKGTKHQRSPSPSPYDRPASPKPYTRAPSPLSFDSFHPWEYTAPPRGMLASTSAVVLRPTAVRSSFVMPSASLSPPMPATRRVHSSQDVSSLAVALLRLRFGNPRATWKSHEQKHAVEVALQPNVDVLIILPTGGGKSLTWEIPAMADPGAEPITVVVLPFIAILADAQDRATRLKIPWKKFNAEQFKAGVLNDPLRMRLLFVTPESTTSQQWKE